MFPITTNASLWIVFRQSVVSGLGAGLGFLTVALTIQTIILLSRRIKKTKGINVKE